MATIVCKTSLYLTNEKQQALINAIGDACLQVFSNYSLYCEFLDPAMVAGDAKDQTTFFVYVPRIELDRRRRLIKALNDVMLDQVGYKGKLKVIVIFKFHDDDAVGVDGVLRLDNQ